MTARGTAIPQDRTLIVTCVGDGKLSGEVTAGAVPWWSVTKTCMAAAALILSERGKLTSTHRSPAAPSRCGNCSHDAGLRDTAVPEYWRGDKRRRAVERNRASVRVEVDKVGVIRPAAADLLERGYLLVRRAIEAAFGADLEAARQALVFAPLGVRGVHIAREPVDISRGAFGNPRNYHPGRVYHGP